MKNSSLISLTLGFTSFIGLLITVGCIMAITVADMSGRGIKPSDDLILIGLILFVGAGFALLAYRMIVLVVNVRKKDH